MSPHSYNHNENVLTSPTRTPLLGHSTPSSTGTMTRRRPARSYVALLLGASFGVLLVWTLTAPDAVLQLHKEVKSLSKPLVQLVQSATIIKPNSQCDPFNVPGQLEVKQGEPDLNIWQPWDRTCNASTLFTDLRNREHLPWLHNKTIAVFGDSIDRDHVEYFCEMARGSMEWIWEGSRYDPPYTYSTSDPKHYNSSSNGQDSGGADQSRPRICLLEEYDFALVFAFHYGLSDGSEAERSLPHFYPPFLFQDRLSSILIPVLKSAKRYPPDILELGTGTWDLQHWTYQDRANDEDRLTHLSSERSTWYAKRFRKALEYAESAFLGNSEEEADYAKTRRTTSFVFREMQQTKMVDSVPPPRVQGLKNLQEHVMRSEKKLASEGGSWTVDPLSRLLIGQEHTYRDAIHPIQLPAGKIWADVILHKLKTLQS